MVRSCSFVLPLPSKPAVVRIRLRSSLPEEIATTPCQFWSRHPTNLGKHWPHRHVQLGNLFVGDKFIPGPVATCVAICLKKPCKSLRYRHHWETSGSAVTVVCSRHCTGRAYGPVGPNCLCTCLPLDRVYTAPPTTYPISTCDRWPSLGCPTVVRAKDRAHCSFSHYCWLCPRLSGDPTTLTWLLQRHWFNPPSLVHFSNPNRHNLVRFNKSSF